MYKSGLRSNHWLKARYLKTVAAGIPADKFDRLCEEFCHRTIEGNIKPKAILTGEIDGKNCIGDEKAKRVAAMVESFGWTRVDSAYSDDRVDLPLFEMAVTAFVVDPGAATESLAKQRDFQILNWR